MGGKVAITERNSDTGIIKVKGKSPHYSYICSLPQTFHSFQNQQFTLEECLRYLKTEGIDFDQTVLLQCLFRYRMNSGLREQRNLPFTFAGPFQMRDVIDSLFQFNLRYQDAVIKIELEKTKDADPGFKNAVDREQALERILRIITVILRTTFFSTDPLYLELTNIELDNIVLKCLSFLLKNQNAMTHESLVEMGNVANEISHLVQEQILSEEVVTLKDTLPFMLYSGIVWWSDTAVQQQFKISRELTILQQRDLLIQFAQTDLAINDFPVFWSEVIESTPCKKLLYFLDDNGELVWHLLFIRLLLEANPNLIITCVVNELPVTNNANTLTLLHYLQRFEPGMLGHERLCICGEQNELSAIDPRFISDNLERHILEADVIMVNGVSFFEKLQYLPAPTYYMFVVYSNTSVLLTGIERYKGVFARIGPHLCCFSHIETIAGEAIPKMDLKTIHRFLQTPVYKKFADRFASEAEANLFLRSVSFQKGIPLFQSVPN